MPDGILAAARTQAPRMVALRRAIHAEPELGLHTPRTRDRIRAALAHLPLEWREGPSTTGLVAVLRGQGTSGAGRRVLLRGDMDALPMPEETGLPFASTVPNTMHACGHDAHVAMLAGAGELLSQRAAEWSGEVLLMFQPGEEGWHGARFMLEDGLLGGGAHAGHHGPLPDAAFALHVMPNAPHGLVGGRPGPLLASADQLDVTITGAGGHASMPHQARDPIPVACELVTALQTLVTRQFDTHDPVVVTIARIEAGTTHNVIPDSAHLKGTLRTLSAAHRARLREAVTRLATHIAAAHGLTARVTITPGFPVTNCDPRAVALGQSVTHALFGPQAFHALPAPIMGAEDFAYVLDLVPGAMFFLGFAQEGEDWTQCCGIHSPRMMLDESVLPHGAALLAALAERYLAEGWT